jgi:hypothetical protein
MRAGSSLARVERSRDNAVVLVDCGMGRLMAYLAFR